MDQFICNLKSREVEIDSEKPDFISVVERYYWDNIVSPKKTHEEMSVLLNLELKAEKKELEDLNVLTKESAKLLMEFDTNSKEDIGNRSVWVLPENESNKVFYDDFNECYYRMNAEPKIVIVYLEAKDSFVSNSSLLEFALLIYRGMNQEEIDKKTPEYKNYLNTIYMLGEMLENIDE